VSERGWVALLRGINLGSRNRVPMAKLREVFEEAGCSSVRTHLQSGNVVFTTSASNRGQLVRTLERAVKAEFDVPAAVVLRSFAELRRVVDAHPFGRDSSKTMVAFLARKPPAAKVRTLEALDISPDEVKAAGSDVYIRYPKGVQGATLSGAKLERHLGVPATIRNWRTVTRLAELTGEA
jgi:uncharacterized protein (DUF1697 family)